MHATGQSMGAMMTLGLNLKHPDMFAASFVVAGQWPADQCAPLARKKLWIVVAEGDDKAYPGENAVTQVIEQAGTPVGRAVWDGKSSAAQFATDMQTTVAGHTPVNYAAMQKGSVLVPGATSGPGANEHMSTWRVAYTIGGIRDSILEQAE